MIGSFLVSFRKKNLTLKRKDTASVMMTTKELL